MKDDPTLFNTVSFPIQPPPRTSSNSSTPVPHAPISSSPLHLIVLERTSSTRSHPDYLVSTRAVTALTTGEQTPPLVLSGDSLALRQSAIYNPSIVEGQVHHHHWRLILGRVLLEWHTGPSDIRNLGERHVGCETWILVGDFDSMFRS